jgi:hypothetical protein
MIETKVSRILYEVLEGETRANALEILRQCKNFVELRKDLYKPS